MADEKLNTGPAENTSPEAAGPTASHIPVFIPETVQALTMGNLNGRAQSPTMAAAIPEMCFLCLRCPAASIPHRSPWSFVSI